MGSGNVDFFHKRWWAKTSDIEVCTVLVEGRTFLSNGINETDFGLPLLVFQAWLDWRDEIGGAGWELWPSHSRLRASSSDSLDKHNYLAIVII